MQRTPPDLETVELELRDALASLTDPLYQPPALLWHVLGCKTAPTTSQFRQNIHRAIQRLRPPDDLPKTTRAWRIYELLTARYVEEKTQKETALRLGMTVRHLRREQQLAVRLLAQSLLEEAADSPIVSTIEPDAGGTGTAETDTAEADADQAWRQQVREEWNRLQVTTTGVPGGLREAVMSAIDLFKAMSPASTVQVALDDEFLLALHPTILRQLFLTAMEKLIQHLHTPNELQVTATENANGVVYVVISGRPAADDHLPDSEFIREILHMQRTELHVAREGDRVELAFLLPLAQRQKVLLVDDNPDLVHLYRRFVEGTRYEIVHTDRGGDALALAEQIQPVSVVLDIMLPDMDGWDLLQTLQNQPTTKAIPVVICSVVRREELAQALGASALLAKPVRRQEFLATLDRVVVN